MHDYTVAKALKVLAERGLLRFEERATDVEAELQTVISSIHLNRQQSVIEIRNGNRSALFPLGPYEEFFRNVFVANGGIE